MNECNKPVAAEDIQPVIKISGDGTHGAVVLCAAIEIGRVLKINLGGIKLRDWERFVFPSITSICRNVNAAVIAHHYEIGVGRMNVQRVVVSM